MAADFKRQAEPAYNRALALLEGARADLLSAQADERAGEINLSYTKVTAPFDGIVTERQVSLGKLVGADNQHRTVLATIVQPHPIYETASGWCCKFATQYM